MNNIDELERHLDVLYEVLNSDNDSDANEDELYEKRIEVRRRMVPFYRQRADIFDLFDDNQIYKVFRFDKASIWYIEGTHIISIVLSYYNISMCINSCIG
jgi:hypothetical protein